MASCHQTFTFGPKKSFKTDWLVHNLLLCQDNLFPLPLSYRCLTLHHPTPYPTPFNCQGFLSAMTVPSAPIPLLPPLSILTSIPSSLPYQFRHTTFRHTNSALPIPPYQFRHINSAIPIPPYKFRHTNSAIPIPP